MRTATFFNRSMSAAVLGYNWLVRRNKAAMDMVRGFAADLHAVLLSAPKTPARA